MHFSDVHFLFGQFFSRYFFPTVQACNEMIDILALVQAIKRIELRLRTFRSNLLEICSNYVKVCLYCQEIQHPLVTFEFYTISKILNCSLSLSYVICYHMLLLYT
jgi:hypothetical protein